MTPTTWIRARSIRADRALVLRLFDQLEWRRHGIGVLQAYVSEGGEAEVRVHVWHPDLLRPGIADHGDIHDHRFRLHSLILHGEIEHEEVRAELDPEGDWDVHQVLHARINPTGEMKRPFAEVVPGPLSATAERVRISRAEYVFLRGEAYTFERGHFHRTVAHGLAITLVTKTEQLDRGARILSRRGGPAIPAFDPSDATAPELASTAVRVLREAREALR